VSERAPSFEHHEHDPHPYGERIKNAHEKNGEKSKEAPKQTPESIDRLLKKIEREANSSETLLRKNGEVDRNQDHTKQMSGQPMYGSKGHAKLTMNKVWKQEKPLERTFSKVVHNNTVDTISNVTGATAARPSGLLFGGIFSVVGSLGVLIISRYYGYEYNFLLSILFFIGGFFFGLLVELLLRLFKRA
jgi:hypothetical protein